MSRYLLCLPGATLACVGLLNQARSVRTMGLPRIANYLTGAALAFLAYAVAAGLVVPEAPFPPASVLNYTLLERTIRVPAAVFRSLCGLAMAFFIFRSLEIFQVEDDRRIAEMEQEQILAEDRERIGRELHDGTIQSIYAAGLGLEEAHHLVAENPAQAQRQLRAIMASLSRTIDDIRRYIFDLREAEDTRELETVLAGLVQDLRLDTLLEVDLEVNGERCCWLSHEQVGHVTQVAREALSNIVQHADASRVKVTLSYEGVRTHLTVTDDGRGIELGSRPDGDGNGGGQGIANMRARAAMLGGTLDFVNTPGGGLTLSLTIPCSECGSLNRETESGETWD